MRPEQMSAGWACLKSCCLLKTYRIQLLPTIWKSLYRHRQEKELGKRHKEYKEGKLKLHGWKEVHEGLRKKYT